MTAVARPNRTGGELLAECLSALGADVVFGLPGAHALPAWEGLRCRRLRAAVMRTELSARPDYLAHDLSWALAETGPAVVVLKERLVAAAPTS